MRLYQCPGCWSWGMWPLPKDEHGSLECECGQRLTRIDLRDSERRGQGRGSRMTPRERHASALRGELAPSPALTREALAAALHEADKTVYSLCWYDHDCQTGNWQDCETNGGPIGNPAWHLEQADAILAALSKTPPPSSTREET